MGRSFIKPISIPNFAKLRRDPVGMLAFMVGSCGAAGLFPWAPGTIGSLIGWGVCLAYQPAPWVWLAIFAAGTWACWRLARVTDDRDPSYVILDEVLGYGIAAWTAGTNFELGLAAFVLFRIFDIWKPGPIRLVDQWSKKHKSAWVRGAGVMMDDVLAGALALLLIVIYQHRI